MAIKTKFYISCHDWKEDNSTFKYSVSLVRVLFEAGEIGDDSDSAVFSYGSLPYLTTMLPEGPKEEHHWQGLAIRITDSYGASTQVSLHLQVMKRTLNLTMHCQ